MATVKVEFRATFIDHESESSTVLGYQEMDDTTSAADLATARDAFCAAASGVSGNQLKDCSVTLRSYTSFAPPAMTVYGDSEDKVYLFFRSASTGNPYSIQAPGPLAADFAADNETVAPAATGIAALITWVTGTGASKSGDTDLQFILGYRRRRKSRKERPGYSTAQG